MNINEKNKNYQKKFEGIPSLIRLVSIKNVTNCFSNNTIIQQKLTVLATGAVSFVSMNKEKEVVESLNFDIDSNTAFDIVSKIAHYFSYSVDGKRYPVTGNYDLTITNTEGNSYFFDGTLNNNYTIDGVNISEYIRNVLHLPQLFVFEDHGLKKDINILEINVFDDNEMIFVDRNKGTLTYKYKDNTISICNYDIVHSFLDKYVEKFTDNLNYSSTIGETWEYEINVSYSYGEDLSFGGKLTKLPYFYKEMLNTIEKMIHKECFGNMFIEKNKNQNNNEFGVALISGNDIPRNNWYKYTDMNLKCGDIVLVNNENNDYVIGKVTRIINNLVYDPYGYIVYRKIIKKL